MFWIVILLIISGLIFIICKFQYHSEESLLELESRLRSGDWKRASGETESLIALIIHRDCKKIPCVRGRSSFLFKYLNQRHLDAGIGIEVTNCTYFSTEDIEKFPLHKLQAIDNLWTKYSQGQFGFSVQASIYQQYGKTSNRSIRNDEFELNEINDKHWTLPAKSKVKPSQIKNWKRVEFFDYMEKHEKDLLLKLGWMATAIDHRGLPVVFFSFSYHLDESSEMSSIYLTPVKGMFPCGLSAGGALSGPTSFLLWRKILRGSAID